MYREMQTTLNQMETGTPEIRAYAEFGRRIGIGVRIRFRVRVRIDRLLLQSVDGVTQCVLRGLDLFGGGGIVVQHGLRGVARGDERGPRLIV